VAGGSSDATAVERTVAYVSSAGSREIISFALDIEVRTLAPLSITAVPGKGPSPTNMPLTVGPRASRLYAAVRSAPFPSTSYAIDGARGALAPLATARLPDAMTYIATDRCKGHRPSRPFSCPAGNCDVNAPPPPSNKQFF
jgi:6-phosphogluconolactonase